MDRAAGIDVSLWQDDNSTPQRMDFKKAYAAGARFVFIKASQSVWIDPDYIYNTQAARDAGLLVGFYHFLTWDRSPFDQAAYFASLLKAWRGHLPPVMDFEARTNAPSRSTATQFALSFLGELERLLDVLPMVYTSPGYFAEFGSASTAWKRYLLWLARYTSAEPTPPLPWDRWEFWQYTAKGPGRAYGAESEGLDMNWYCGSLDDLYQKYGRPEPWPAPSEPVTPPAVPSEPAVPAGITVTVPLLNVRTRPNIFASKADTLVKGSYPVEVLETSGNGQDIWLRVRYQKEGWVAARYGGRQLAKVV